MEGNFVFVEAGDKAGAYVMGSWIWVKVAWAAHMTTAVKSTFYGVNNGKTGI